MGEDLATPRVVDLGPHDFVNAVYAELGGERFRRYQPLPPTIKTGRRQRVLSS